MVNRVVTFGELMLRLSANGFQRFLQADLFNVSYGGAEANVAVSLANFGFESIFVTKLPKNEIGQAAVNSIRRFGVETNRIIRGGDRTGIYYLEKGASQRPSKVIYDRANSSIASANEDDFKWDEIFKDASWFHFTGITPALSDSVAKICLKACQVAKTMNIPISCDLNFRKNLWSKQKAASVMGNLMEYVDLCIANEEDAGDVFNIHSSKSDIKSNFLDYSDYQNVAQELADRFSFKYVAITLRGSVSASDNSWSAMLYDNKSFYYSKSYPIHIVDRVGGGDSFAAGLIFSILTNKDPQSALDFSVAASCLKHSIEGDYNLVSVDEVEKLVNGDGSGRVMR